MYPATNIKICRRATLLRFWNPDFFLALSQCNYYMFIFEAPTLAIRSVRIFCSAMQVASLPDSDGTWQFREVGFTPRCSPALTCAVKHGSMQARPVPPSRVRDAGCTGATTAGGRYRQLNASVGIDGAHKQSSLPPHSQTTSQSRTPI